jgi:hypothetical protein
VNDPRIMPIKVTAPNGETDIFGVDPADPHLWVFAKRMPDGSTSISIRNTAEDIPATKVRYIRSDEL